MFQRGPWNLITWQEPWSLRLKICTWPTHQICEKINPNVISWTLFCIWWQEIIMGRSWVLMTTRSLLVTYWLLVDFSEVNLILSDKLFYGNWQARAQFVSCLVLYCKTLKFREHLIFAQIRESARFVIRKKCSQKFDAYYGWWFV